MLRKIGKMTIKIAALFFIAVLGYVIYMQVQYYRIRFYRD